jgi:hypothetical protein
MLATDPVLMARFDILVSIPSVGETTALISSKCREPRVRDR